ncbi:uncharacterized protein PHALS_13929 [Plasmopara halstedii]|uniref:Uncharacterized protein n=1 Tax=Plasmopara halstedii TaxID=4781 RepID=A0A0P1A4I1_PLAHL|nr:uncharacterized protein PHALS_13929 [Plasmopara halstedii]CEG35177.1 hypothetical protein PHALS_13929 [Plasmopara halstedii]|eukprot:XP_024571546.1 hypothetical protein PHALS_13929 [Plasmopara halstedii]
MIVSVVVGYKNLPCRKGEWSSKCDGSKSAAETNDLSQEREAIVARQNFDTDR